MKFKHFVKKNAIPLIAGGVILVAGATGAYFYTNKQDDKLSAVENQTPQTQEEAQASETKGENVNMGQSTATPKTPIVTTSIGDVSFSITIDDPSTRTTASASLYGPAGTYGVEKLVNGSWTTVVASFNYSGTGGYVFDTISSSATESHYRVFSLNGSTRTATSGDTIISWNLVNENGIYTIPVAR